MAKELNVLGTTMFIRVASADTGGAYSVVEQSGPPGDLTPPHADANEDISLVVFEGSIEVEMADGTQSRSAGGTLSVPRGTHHTIRSVGSDAARLIYVFAPGGVEKFFEEVDALGSDATPESVGEIATRYGIRIGPPA